MTNINPKLIKEWHPKKNGSLSPNDFSAGSNYNAWWLGECGHEWHAKIKDRSKGTGCPICSGKKIIKGINDLATKQQDLMADWDFEKNTLVSPYEVSESSGKKFGGSVTSVDMNGQHLFHIVLMEEGAQIVLGWL